MKTRLISILILISMLFLYSCESGNLDSDNTNGNNSSENGGSESPEDNGGEDDDGSGENSGTTPGGDGTGDSDGDGTGDSDGDGTGENSGTIPGGDGTGDSDGGNTGGDDPEGSGDVESPDGGGNGDTGDGNDPDYGTATVYEKGSTVYLVGAAEERKLIGSFVGSLGELGITVSASDGAEKKNEIIVGNVEDKAASVKANAILSKMPKSSYFNARYLVYASSGKIAIAYDYNEYTPISALEYITDALAEAIIDDDGYVALPEGVVAQGIVDLIAEQEKLDEKTLDEAWAKLEKKVSAEVYEAFRTLYTMYDDKLITWYANLYDPNVGAYYSTTTQKQTDCYFPGPEVTMQAMRFLGNSGMLDGLGKYQDNIPSIIKYSITYYCKSIQDPNGYFYDPQYEKHSASGRDLSWCTQLLSAFGSAPVYDTPNGKKGDGITADMYWDNLVASGQVDECIPRPLNLVKLKEQNSTGKLTSSIGGSVGEAVSRVVLTATAMDYLSDYISYIDYLHSIDVDTDPYTGCNYLNSISTQVKTQSDVLFNKQGAFVFDDKYGEEYRMYDGMNLMEITIAYYSSKINPETGVCGQPSATNPTGREYLFTNGFFKIIAVYNIFGVAYPTPEKAAETLLMATVSNQASTQNICDVYNVWSSLNELKSNVQKYADARTKETVLGIIENGIRENGAEAILKSYNKMKNYKKSDGGYASTTKTTESNIDAIGKATHGMIIPMFSLYGAETVPMYTRHHLMQYFDILLSLERSDKVYFKPLANVLTFEDLPDASQLYLRSATADLSVEPGKNGDPALLVYKSYNKNQSIIDISLMDKVADPTGIVFETDIKISNVKKANPIALTFGPRGGSHSDRAYRFQFVFDAADGSAISISEMQWSGSGSSYSTINSFSTAAKVGEWFNLRIEYDVTNLDTTDYPETRIYINNELVYTTNEVYAKPILGDDTSAAATFIMFSPLICEMWLDNTTVRQSN